jgi:hypothetical protein
MREGREVECAIAGATIGEGATCATRFDVNVVDLPVETFCPGTDFLGSRCDHQTLASSGGKPTDTNFLCPSGLALLISHAATSQVELQPWYLQVIVTLLRLLLWGTRCLGSCGTPFAILRRQITGCPFGSTRLWPVYRVCTPPACEITGRWSEANSAVNAFAISTS